jgi:uncharacterized phiE125 gp8 family phage protein
MPGTLNLTVTSPPQNYTEPLTVAEVEHYLGLVSLSPVDAERTALLEALISGAREQAEILQGRDLVQKQCDLALDSFAEVIIELRPNLATVDLVKYRDSGGTWTTLTENTDYIVDTSKQPGTIQPVYGGTWPSFTAWPTSAVLIQFTAGLAASDIFWSDAGHRIKIGMKLLISHWFNGRLPFETGTGAISEYPYAVTALLSQGTVARRF